eukprot:8873217-Prorocentrum_lima.AAC.1
MAFRMMLKSWLGPFGVVAGPARKRLAAMKKLCHQVVLLMSMSQREERLATAWAILSQVAARAMDFDMRCL